MAIRKCAGAIIVSVLSRFAKQAAVGTLMLRAGIVGVNFAVMLGLAGLLGFDGFGRLVATWSVALVAGTIISLGGPLILLRGLTDGQGMRPAAVIRLMVIYPLALSGLGAVALELVWPVLPWVPVMGAAFCINLLTCLASVLRGYGSIQGSMALRDAGPQALLFCAALFAGKQEVQDILLIAALLMLILALLVWFWVTLTADWPVPDVDAPKQGVSLSLWGTSILGAGIAQIDLLVGGVFLSSTDLGTYAILRRVANLVALPVSVATWVSAAPISAAMGAGDLGGLQRASAQGSRIAVSSGTILFGLGLLGLPLVVFSMPDTARDDTGLILAVLLLGSFMQVLLASGFTVATLGGYARYAALSRLAAILIYLFFALHWGAATSAVANAVCYSLAISLGSLFLWGRLWVSLGVDTSAAVLWHGRGVAWKPS